MKILPLLLQRIIFNRLLFSGDKLRLQFAQYTTLLLEIKLVLSSTTRLSDFAHAGGSTNDRH